MNLDFDIYGVMIPAIGAAALISFLVNAVLRRILSKLGVYRFIWHRPLFDTAMYLCVLCLLTLSTDWMSL